MSIEIRAEIDFIYEDIIDGQKVKVKRYTKPVVYIDGKVNTKVSENTADKDYN